MAEIDSDHVCNPVGRGSVLIVTPMTVSAPQNPVNAKPAAQGIPSMKKSLLTLTASALILAGSMGTAQAQSSDDNDDMMQQGQGMMMQQGQQGQRMMQRGQRGERMMQRGRDGGKRYGKHRGRYWDMDRYHRGRHGMGYGRGMGRGMGYGGGMGGGMGHGAMMQVVFAIMDADGNGSLSLQEVQDAHARIFAHMDANDDGEVTKGEIRAFFRAGRDRRGMRDWSEMSDDMDDADDLNLTDEVDDDDNDDN
jgi:hypothetical protein